MNNEEKMQIKTLLQKTEVIRYNYSLRKKDDAYNIFTILRNRSEEVNLHSKFIATILNPKGTHEFKTIFLELFLEKVGVKSTSLDNAIVSIEKSIGEISKDKSEGGRIDILIENIGDRPIVIENKIYAEDQEKQLERYHNYSPSAIIVYLTLHGSEPSKQSLGNVKLEDVILMSYEDDIFDWMEKCIEKASKKPSVRETLIQYQNLIKKLTGNTTTMEERLDYIGLMSKSENVKAAKKIADNWIHLRWYTEWYFWNEFEQKIKSLLKCEILEDRKYSGEYLDSVIHKKKDKDPYYGITFRIGKYKKSNLNVMIQRGNSNLYYGLKTEDNVSKAELQERLKSISLEPRSEKWVVNKAFEQDIDFNAFSNETTLDVCDNTKRDVILTDLIEQIKFFIEECKEKLGNDLVLTYNQ